MDDVVRITEVSPRDGLQAETATVATAEKAALVRACAHSGVVEVEVSSFVRPDWVPQLGDAPEVFRAVASDKPAGVQFSALVPNERGLDGLLEVNRAAEAQTGVAGLIDKAAVFTAASETFSEKNTNASIERTLERFAPVVARCREAGLRTRGYVSCVIACPFEGPILPSAVAAVSARLLELGVDEIDLGDTIGAGTPETIEAMLLEVIEAIGGEPTNRWGEPTVTLHLHDTFGRAASCVERALELGVRSFDGSAAGLGGCPYATTDAMKARGERAPGNISTRTLVETVERAGFTTGLDHSKLALAEATATRVIQSARLGEVGP